MAEKNKLAQIPSQQMPERQSNLLSQLWDEATGAFARYGRRSGAQRDASLALLNQAVDPNTDPLTGAGMKALGLAGLITHPLAFFPTGDEWRERLANAGNTSRLGQSVGGMLGDLPSIVDPHLLAGGGALAMAPLAAKVMNKADNVADAGIIAYHGTTEKGIPRLSTRNAIETPGAVFASNKGEVADTFTVPREYGEPVFEDEFGNEIARGEVLKLRLQPKNTLVYPEAEGQKFIDDSALQARAVKEAKAAGHDMIHVKNVMEGIGERYPGDVYVILDDSIISILERYGIPMTIGAGGAMMVAGQDMPPEFAAQIGGT